MNEELKQLEARVDKLIEWKEAKERQQLSYPVDPESRKILDEHVLTTDATEVVPVGLLTADTALKVIVDGVTYYVLADLVP